MPKSPKEETCKDRKRQEVKLATGTSAGASRGRSSYIYAMLVGAARAAHIRDATSRRAQPGMHSRHVGQEVQGNCILKRAVAAENRATSGRTQSAFAYKTDTQKSPVARAAAGSRVIEHRGTGQQGPVVTCGRPLGAERLGGCASECVCEPRNCILKRSLD